MCANIFPLPKIFPEEDGIMVKIVTREREVEVTLDDLRLGDRATDAEIISAAERRLEQSLNNYIVTRHEDNIVVSPTPVFG